MKDVLRPYQIDVLAQIWTRFSRGDREVVLAACPNAGKTLMAITFIETHADSTFLVLTHATNVLKEQWRKNFETSGVAASSVPGESRVTYGLPQSRKQLKSLGKIDYLIVDEAHEWTHANTVQNLIKELNPTHILYLTGTPSEFIRLGHSPIIVPGSLLIEAGHSSDVHIGLAVTSAKLEIGDYNSDGDVLESRVSELESSVESDLDALLKRMHTDPAHLYKTMIVCQSIKQADGVTTYFKNLGISVICSHSENDPNSDGVATFQNDTSVKILVVVNRGILGFNMVNLVNVVDLTCSRNPNRIYQLFARVMRKSPQHPQKYFYKLSPINLMAQTDICTRGALMLLEEKWIAKYNGRNFDQIEILTNRNFRERIKAFSESAKQPGYDPAPIDKSFYDLVSVNSFLNYQKTMVGENTEEYALMRIDAAKVNLLGIRTASQKADQNKSKLLDMARRGDQRPSVHKGDLGQVLRSYTAKSSGGYDTEFHQALKHIRPDWFKNDSSSLKKELLLNLANTGGARPKRSKTELGRVLGYYTQTNSSSYDHEFDKAIRKIRPDWFGATEQKKHELLALAETNSPRPNRKTHKLAIVLSNYTRPADPSYDPEFDSNIRAIRPDWFGPRSNKFKTAS